MFRVLLRSCHVTARLNRKLPNVGTVFENNWRIEKSRCSSGGFKLKYRSFDL